MFTFLAYCLGSKSMSAKLIVRLYTPGIPDLGSTPMYVRKYGTSLTQLSLTVGIYIHAAEKLLSHVCQVPGGAQGVTKKTAEIIVISC